MERSPSSKQTTASAGITLQAPSVMTTPTSSSSSSSHRYNNNISHSPSSTSPREIIYSSSSFSHRRHSSYGGGNNNSNNSNNSVSAAGYRPPQVPGLPTALPKQSHDTGEWMCISGSSSSPKTNHVNYMRQFENKKNDQIRAWLYDLD